ncbi:4-hydroxyacetophenone monooxygenase [Prauserella marina]|uniref:Predicted flavoprotein CzcO associated with the cation diffusion facilitator CzcD n=1 Tax=Prauserella marina TaxID=530584 RepID=A0A222VSD1_9PSEU|nr:NAD(P)/FAD-dependent oxidoreductase [Prauserella marina]ASR36827.1 4-hydroxyacetophenone monooxygenase [Prauserella marina]PWV80260.1 cation diffusion facilitator CzcD-associated flavoprotein CzcO [Prauserella marina]SDD50475.1 Predicted flavoprotein CzcO associated with the cation diffusion facilitator CzcD [Prauserella marina]
MSATPHHSADAVIVGAGFGGIAAAIELSRSGFTDIVILERASDLGGVWRENTYPGAGCDVPSPLYSFSFEHNPAWPRRYASQPDIHAYLRRTARKYGVFDRIRFGTEVTSAEFDGSTATWLIRTATGDGFTGRVFVPATGQLSRPAFPDIPGMDTFRGDSFHSAEWRHDLDLTGARIAVIGTGASAVQFVPRIQRQAKTLTVFQRSAPYLLPKRDHGYTAWHHRALRAVPLARTLDRLGFWLYAEFAQQCLSKWQFLTPLFQRQTEKHLREAVADPALRDKLTPDYALGCKRVLFSNDYLPAIAKSNVDLVTDEIVAVTGNGVRDANGRHHEADVIIYGTGFAAGDLMSPIDVRGLDGRSLAETWQEGARAHLGITVPGFPGMFLMYGPNTNLGGGSVIYMLESQARYVRDAVRLLAAHPSRYLDVREDAEQRWDEEIQGRLERSVWTRCRSWYRNSYGRVVANWPGRTHEYRRRTASVDLRQFRVGSASGTPSR